MSLHDVTNIAGGGRPDVFNPLAPPPAAKVPVGRTARAARRSSWVMPRLTFFPVEKARL